MIGGDAVSGLIRRSLSIAAIGVALASAHACSNGSPAAGGPSRDGGSDAAAPTGGTRGGAGGAKSSGGSGGVNGAGGIVGAGGTTTTRDGGASPDAGSAKGGASGGGTSGHTPMDGGATGAGPTGLLVNLLPHPENATLTDAAPKLGWIVNATGSGVTQTAYRILVSSSAALLAADNGDLWDSGKVVSSQSLNVPYAGKALAAKATYVWKVQTWDSAQTASDWSAPQTFVMGGALGAYATATEALVTTHVAPVTASAVGTGRTFFDFGRAAFGWLEVTLNAPAAGTVSVTVGEKASGQASTSAQAGPFAPRS